jgi:DNA-directed RNA polymerase specialized sigma24 family protein
MVGEIALFPLGAITASGDEGSITRWLGDLKSGSDDAAQQLWQRYFDQLVRLARRKLRAATGIGAGIAEDEEDAALSAFHSFCRGAAEGRYPGLADREALWRLLVRITVRKALDQIQRQGAIKRGGGRLVGESALADGDGTRNGAVLDHFVGPEASPDLAALVAEEYRRLWSRLGHDSLRMVLDLCLEGYRRPEIAARMGCTVKTVGRKLDVIRTVWLEAQDDHE